jgi:AcrR family transcriptional regulator
MPRTPLTSATVIRDAAALADTEGLDAVTLSAVARRLAVQTPSLYSHVRDLAALRDGITAIALDQLADAVGLAIAGRSGSHALRGMAEAHRAFAAQSPGLWQSLQRKAGMDAVASDAARRLVALNDAALEAYALSPDDRVHATRLIGSTINGFITLERAGSFDHRSVAIEASWSIAIDGLHAVITGWNDGKATA